MLDPVTPSLLPAWSLVTRLGEAEILLPVALLTALALCFKTERRDLALRWMLWLFAAVALTTATKVAFIGWGLGLADLNFTGISGHTMFAAAIYPMLMVSLMAGRAAQRYRLALFGGCALALLIGLSRIAVGAHSASEVLAGLLVGGVVSVAVLALNQSRSVALPPVLPALLLVWVSLTPSGMPASQTHSLVTRLALTLSGHVVPYTRSDLQRASGQSPS